MAKWVGYAVSVNCGDPLGCYQGTILEADGNTLTLTKAFRNGFPYPKSKVTLNAADIKDLQIIESQTQPTEQTHSTVAVSKHKKGQRATVCENLQAIPSNPGIQGCGSNSNKGGALSIGGIGAGVGGSSVSALPRSKPIDIQGTRNNKISNHAGSVGNGGSTPKVRGGDKARRRNEAFFGSAADPALADDFDFEGNLALFDKAALWESMRSAKPDLLRQAEEPTRFRHDEHVLPRAPAVRMPVRVPDRLRGPLDYVTDEGVIVPSVVSSVRREVWAGLRRCGVEGSAGTLLGRAAADVALRLVGGGRRLDPRNAHQAPTVVALVGNHRAGARAVAAARLLHSHAVNVAVLLANDGGGEPCLSVERELSALRLSTGRGAETSPGRLPSADLVLLALHDIELSDQEQDNEALSWARSARAAIVALDPPECGWAGVSARASVVAGLPGALSPDLGRVYLADVAPPPPVFADLGIAYRPPFGAHSVLPLHPADATD